ncbi:hypothetical protein LMTR13_25245 [Bradyrhizobium icense]|uniref:Uncharacterized protein n=1 Tax=Bradyrhizobium icense TaxID=1274631 RepID=A0A1B1UJN2_9BRAD|nr:hypothetical protein LMTR13_25245 [Bradyrhizobium icense]
MLRRQPQHLPDVAEHAILGMIHDPDQLAFVKKECASISQCSRAGMVRFAVLRYEHSSCEKAIVICRNSIELAEDYFTTETTECVSDWCIIFT